MSLLALVVVALTTPAWPVQEYRSGGKRDPFLRPEPKTEKRVRASAAPLPLDQRPPGLAGLLISEVTPVGVSRGKNTSVAVLRGVDNFTYMATVGSRLFDGSLVGIDLDGVIFRRRIEQVDENRLQQEVKKLLDGSVRISEPVPAKIRAGSNGAAASD